MGGDESGLGVDLFVTVTVTAMVVGAWLLGERLLRRMEGRLTVSDELGLTFLDLAVRFSMSDSYLLRRVWI